jgi:hypothetical protein
MVVKHGEGMPETFLLWTRHAPRMQRYQTFGPFQVASQCP